MASSAKKLAQNNFAVEHFIPYAFVSHDLIWNLTPADPSFNSRKNDKLPRMEDYFDGYSVLNICRKSMNLKFLESIVYIGSLVYTKVYA